MDDLTKILITSSTTVITGISMFVIGQVFLKVFLEPYKRYKEVLCKIVETIVFHRNLYGLVKSSENNPELKAKLRKGQEEMRKVGTELLSAYMNVGFKFILIMFFRIPTKKKLEKAFGELIGLSNNFFRDDPYDVVNKKIKTLRETLKLDFIE